MKLRAFQKWPQNSSSFRILGDRARFSMIHRRTYTFAPQALHRLSLAYRFRRYISFRQFQADRNKAKVVKRLEERKKQLQEGEKERQRSGRSRGHGGGARETRSLTVGGAKMKTQKQCMEELRKCVEKVPIPAIRKGTLNGISKVSDCT